MSFSETIFLFFLALIVFGPKKLPEIARQAGKLLAELRRASNEFKSQIETEIAHLEVEKNKQEILPPSSPPEGTVASLSLNAAAAIEGASPDPNATLAATAGPAPSDGVAVMPSGDPAHSTDLAVGDPAAPAVQDSHV